MDRRGFLAAMAASAVVRDCGRCAGPVRAADQDHIPLRCRRGGDALCRLIAQNISETLGRTVIVENRTGGDGLIGIKSVKNASPDGTTILITTGPTMYLLPMVETAAELRRPQGLPAGLAARPFRFRHRRKPGDRREGFQATRRLAQGQSRQGHLRRAGQRHHSALHRFAAGGAPAAADDTRPLSRQRADHERPHRRPSAVRHRHRRQLDPPSIAPAASGSLPSAARSDRRSCPMCRR